MSLHVLIVDDNQDHADTLAILTRMWGHTASVAYDGVMGLQAAEAEHPDCLILDARMPGMDGYSLARIVRQKTEFDDAKLVAMSAFSDAEHVRKTEEAGFDYRLTKPADPAELQRMLKMIDHIVHLTEKTEQLAERTATAAERTEAIAGETKSLIQEVKQDIQEVKQEVKEIRQEVREVKDRVDQVIDGEENESKE